MRQKMHAAGADGCGNAKNRKVLIFHTGPVCHNQTRICSKFCGHLNPGRHLIDQFSD